MEQKLINLLKLNFDLDDFYSITINPEWYPEQITMQGRPTPEKLLKYTNLGFSFEKGSNENSLQAIKDRVKITLY